MSGTFAIVNPPELGAPRGFAHGLVAPAGGRLLFVAGQTAGSAALKGPRHDNRRHQHNGERDEKALHHDAMIDETSSARTSRGSAIKPARNAAWPMTRGALHPCARRSRTPVSRSDLLSFWPGPFIINR